LFERPQLTAVVKRLREPRRFIQVLAGPRQVGKTTLARQAMEACRLPAVYASADEPTLRDRVWLETQWDHARLLAGEQRRGALLVLDEVQKVPGWSELVKRLWDEDSAARARLRVLVLGSAPLLVQKGLTESLAGRFEVLRLPHWTLPEMRAAFGWDLERFLFFGGYPGAAPLVRDRQRWASYILDAIVETTIARDVLLLARVDKPALLRQLFRLACDHSAQVLSYQKMLGQLQDAGNTTTLAHYLELLAGAGLLMGLQKFFGSRVKQRGSIPKLLVLNTALMTAHAGEDLRSARRDGDFWGRLVESAVGAHLAGHAATAGFELLYWRERNAEVDYVVREGQRVLAIEVKGSPRKGSLPGMAAFAKRYPAARRLLVGGGGIPVEEFLGSPPARWLRWRET
jgi:predicted AAA+ superfamily ATPase